MNFNLKVGLIVLLALVHGTYSMDKDTKTLIKHFNQFGVQQGWQKPRTALPPIHTIFAAREEIDNSDVVSDVVSYEGGGDDGFAEGLQLQPSSMQDLPSSAQENREFAYYECDHCRLKFEYKDAIDIHVIRKHGALSIRDQIQLVKKNYSKSRTEAYFCCGRSFLQSNWFNTHRRNSKQCPYRIEKN